MKNKAMNGELLEQGNEEINSPTFATIKGLIYNLEPSETFIRLKLVLKNRIVHDNKHNISLLGGLIKEKNNVTS